MADATAVTFYVQVGYIKCYHRDHISLPKGVWLWSRDLFFIVSPPKIFLD